MREIVFDTETTGLDPKTGDRVVEIGCVELIDHFPTGATYHQYINPERDMPQEAFNVHGLSAEFLSDKPVFADVADAFVEFIGDSILIAHNASFDINFLNHELSTLGHATIGMDRVIDTLALARRKHPGGQNSLDALCRRFGIDNSARTLHGALLDSEILADVYLELIGGHQAALNLSEQTASRGGGEVTDTTRGAAIARPSPLGPRLSDDERAAHDAFVLTLGEEAIWSKYS